MLVDRAARDGQVVAARDWLRRVRPRRGCDGVARGVHRGGERPPGARSLGAARRRPRASRRARSASTTPTSSRTSRVSSRAAASRPIAADDRRRVRRACRRVRTPGRDGRRPAPRARPTSWSCSAGWRSGPVSPVRRGSARARASSTRDDLDVRTLALGPLPDEVIVDLAGAEAVELAGGNPLLARELALAHGASARELAHAQAAFPRKHVRRRPACGADRPAPRAARARCATGELDLAATCGEVFWPETIGVTGALGVMCRSGLVRLRPDSAIAGSTEAEWTHPLLREVAYDRLDTDGPARRARDRWRTGSTTPRPSRRRSRTMPRPRSSSARRDESAFVGDVSARAARVALDRFALANADRWTALVRETGHEPVPGTADTLEAELLLRRGEFERSGTLADRWTERGLTTSAPTPSRSAPRRISRRGSTTPPNTLPRQRSPASPTAAGTTNSPAPTSNSSNASGNYEQAANPRRNAAAPAARARGDTHLCRAAGGPTALCNGSLHSRTRGEGDRPVRRRGRVRGGRA